MGLYADISELVNGGYATSHTLEGDVEVPVNLATGSVDSLDDVRLLLPEVLDVNEVDIAMVNGSLTSCYGSEAEKTFVLLIDNDGSYWVHAFEYGNLNDYNTGVALQTPSVESRA